MDKQPLPPGQPRSLRSIAEQNAPPSSFPSQPAYDKQAGIPVAPGIPGNQKYYDRACELAPPGQGARPADKRPMKGLSNVKK